MQNITTDDKETLEVSDGEYLNYITVSRLIEEIKKLRIDMRG